MEAQQPKRIANIVTWVLFLILSVWWLALMLGIDTQVESHSLLWAASYQSVAIWGGLLGLLISRFWGGFKSVFGRAVIFLSLGLLFQVVGQSTFSFYNIILHVEVPYPSIADIGFFGSIPLYIYGILLLGRATGFTISLKSSVSKAQVFVVLLFLLSFSYFSFLRGYEIGAYEPLRVFLDFAYPLGQAIYVALAVLVYLLSRKMLGGVMKNKILLILAALVVQYLADYNFLFQAINGTWVNGGYGDYIYLVAYFLMALGLISVGNLFSANKEHIKQ